MDLPGRHLARPGVRPPKRQAPVLQKAPPPPPPAAPLLPTSGKKRLREAGKETSLNVLDAEREVFSARINQISAEFDARIASYLLARRTGMLTPAALGLAGK